MKDENMSAPEIRFKGFTNDWTQRKFFDIAPLQRGFDLPKSEMIEGRYPVVMSNGILHHHNEYKAKAPGVVTGRSGTIGKLHYVECDYWPHNTALWVTDFMGNFPKFIFHLYNNVDLSRFGTGTGVPTLNRNDVHDEKTHIPCLEEQMQISNFMDTLDNTIHSHQQKLNHLRKLKKGYLQLMFPQDGESVPRIRFEGFTGNWQSVRLGDIVAKLKSYSLSRDVETKDATGYRYIHYGDIHKQVADIITDDAQLPRINAGEYVSLKQGDLVLADASEDYVGIAEPCVILHEPQERIIAGLHTIALRPINTDSLFLYHLFYTDGFRKFGGFVGTGLKVFGITFPNLSKYEMKLPSFAEQSFIGDFFKSIDCQSASLSAKVKQLKQLKAAYLQKMFM